MSLTFGSVCSGIEAATVAWKPLGWKAAWYAEIEKFPSRVLAARHGETPNLGDMTKLHDTEAFRGSTLDVLVGGTPCQSFSIAGLRKGLADPRGNLALVFLGLIDRARPRWVVWENVPGVLSSWSDAPDGEADADVAGGDRDLFGGPVGDGRGGSGGNRDEVVEQTNDFDTFLRGLSELGYGVAWAVLDAQHFGVPQRRQRVFVVAHLGAAAPAEAVLFDRHCLCGHPAPSRETGERAARPIGRGASSGGGPRIDADTADNLIPKGFSESGKGYWGQRHGDIGPLRAHADPGSSLVAHTLRGEGFDASEDGTGRGTPIVPVDAPKLYSIMPQNSGKDYKAREVEVTQPLMASGPTTGNQGGDIIVQPVAGTLQASGKAAGSATQQDAESGLLIPTKGDVAGTLIANHGNIKADDAWTGKLVAFSAQDHGADLGKDISPTVRKGGDGGGVQVAVCIPGQLEEKPFIYVAIIEERGTGVRHEVKDTWPNGWANLIFYWTSGNQSCDCNRAAILTGGDAIRGDDDSEVCCSSEDDEQFILRELRIISGDRPRVIYPEKDYLCQKCEEGFDDKHADGAGGLAPAECPRCGEEAAIYDMRGNGDGKNAPTLTGHHAGAVSDFSPMVFEPRFARNGRGAPEEIVPPLKAQSGETGKGDAAPVVVTPMILDEYNQTGSETCYPLRTAQGDGIPKVAAAEAFMENQRGELRTSNVSDALKGSGGKPGQGYQAAVVGAAVRRLTPRECERLQGFPDDYTLIPGGNRTDEEDYAETVEYLIETGWPVAEAMALADTPDGPRYKALGNSMAVPVMNWIGRRINEVHQLLYKK